MKKCNVFAAPVFAAAMVMSASAIAATANSTATVTIKTPIAITETTALSFGTVIPTAAATPATVVLDHSDSATSADATITGATTGDFTVTGADNSAFTISGLGTVSMTGAGTPMSLTLTSNPAAGSTNLSSGSATINVGGSLSVGANQQSGAYSASYAVTVNYD